MSALEPATLSTLPIVSAPATGTVAVLMPTVVYLPTVVAEHVTSPEHDAHCVAAAPTLVNGNCPAVPKYAVGSTVPAVTCTSPVPLTVTGAEGFAQVSAPAANVGTVFVPLGAGRLTPSILLSVLAAGGPVTSPPRLAG